MHDSPDDRFERLLAREGPALRRMAAAYAGSLGEEDDLFQEICFAIWKALPSFRGESSERTFAFRIGHNRGLSWRSRRRLQAVPLEATHEAAAGDPAPDELVIRQQRRTRLLQALHALPPRARQVLLLRLEGQTVGEIAEVLGITENNAGVRLSRARGALSRALHDAGGW